MSRPFQDLLREHRGGLTHDELSDALHDLVAAVTDEGKAGSLTVTFKVKPMGKGEGLEVSADIKCKPPVKTPGVSIFFATPENALVREDPRQKNLDLREVPPASVARALA